MSLTLDGGMKHHPLGRNLPSSAKYAQHLEENAVCGMAGLADFGSGYDCPDGADRHGDLPSSSLLNFRSLSEYGSQALPDQVKLRLDNRRPKMMNTVVARDMLFMPLHESVPQTGKTLICSLLGSYLVSSRTMLLQRLASARFANAKGLLVRCNGLQSKRRKPERTGMNSVTLIIGT